MLSHVTPANRDIDVSSGSICHSQIGGVFLPRRPPKKWFKKMKRKVKKQYPTYGEKRINKIVAGIWYDYKPATRKRIVVKEGKKMGRKKKHKGKKWGKIGSPKSAKRKKWLKRIRKKR